MPTGKGGNHTRPHAFSAKLAFTTRRQELVLALTAAHKSYLSASVCCCPLLLSIAAYEEPEYVCTR